nr:hypothetical protein 345p_00068 [Serratia entomophila]ULG11508.1 hypothetical protein 398p_00008 [Serratia entomophila]ULG14502.1 hypothetical protein 142p_00079 [Serratia proteamaculans]
MTEPIPQHRVSAGQGGGSAGNNTKRKGAPRVSHAPTDITGKTPQLLLDQSGYRYNV